MFNLKLLLNALEQKIHPHQVKLGILSVYIFLLICMLWIPKYIQSLLPNKQTLNIIVFPEMISVEALREFTKKTGISINAKHVETDAELETYLIDPQANYDLACASDYLVSDLKREGRIEPITLELIPNYNNLHPLFRQNKDEIFSIPCVWTLLGIGIDTGILPLPKKPSWNMLFEETLHKICVPDDPRNLITLGAIVLKYPLQALKKKELSCIMQLLQKQKKIVELYTDTNIALLFANKVVPLAFTSFKTIELISEYYPNVKFCLPKEGGIRISQDWIILKNSTNKTIAHEFINFFIDQKVARINEENTEFLPTNDIVLSEYWSPAEQKGSCPLPQLDMIQAANKAAEHLSPNDLSMLWITLKST